jgi:hypothetical protein
MMNLFSASGLFETPSIGQHATKGQQWRAAIAHYRRCRSQSVCLYRRDRAGFSICERKIVNFAML